MSGYLLGLIHIALSIGGTVLPCLSSLLVGYKIFWRLKTGNAMLTGKT